MAREPYILHSLSSCVECGASGDDFASPSIECWEELGELVCEDCAEGALERWAEDNDQFGVGA
jgi:hypothetical protein